MFNDERGSQSHDFPEDDKYIIREEKCEISPTLTPNQGDLTPPAKLYPLELEFTTHGYDYRQILRTKEIVIYQAQDDSITFYEIFKPRVRAITPNNVALSRQFAEGYTHAEQYPSNSDFGSWAWCCRGMKAVSRVLATHFPGVYVDLTLLQKGGVKA